MLRRVEFLARKPFFALETSLLLMSFAWPHLDVLARRAAAKLVALTRERTPVLEPTSKAYTRVDAHCICINVSVRYNIH